MRRRVFVSLIMGLGLLIIGSSARCESLIEMRGFKVGHCYSQRAIRRCVAGGADAPKTCTLEIFSESAGALELALDGRKDALQVNQDQSADFGIFRFKLAKAEPALGSIIAIQRFSIREWDARDDRLGLAHEVSCR